MILRGRMLVVIAACLAMVIGGPVPGLAQSAKDTADLARQVLDVYDLDSEADRKSVG